MPPVSALWVHVRPPPETALHPLPLFTEVIAIITSDELVVVKVAAHELATWLEQEPDPSRARGSI